MSGILQDYYNEFRTGCWAVPDPNECLCRGSGWALSDLDTFHQCPCHYNGQCHPEDYDEGDFHNEPQTPAPVNQEPLPPVKEERRGWTLPPQDTDLPF